MREWWDIGAMGEKDEKWAIRVGDLPGEGSGTETQREGDA